MTAPPKMTFSASKMNFVVDGEISNYDDGSKPQKTRSFALLYAS